MKRFLTLLTLVAVSICSYAYDFEEGGIYYDITSSTKKTVSVTFKETYFNSYSGIVVIPSDVTHNGTTYSVTSIRSFAFQDCEKLSYITIPNSVTSIEECAFLRCKALTFVSMGSSVTGIGSSAFSGCSSLTSITIPRSVINIEGNAFGSCSSLTSILVEEDNPNYDSRDNCNAIIETRTNTLLSGCKNTTIPNSVTSIGINAFTGCSDLTSVTIPNSVTSIGIYAFYRCYNLTSITIPNSVTSIGGWAFSGCSGLTSVTLSNSLTNIEDGVFSLCTTLTSVTIPNSVTSIGNDAFSGCRSLTSVTIPNSVTSIGSDAFYGCSGLTSITIPGSAISIGASAFSGCTNLFWVNNRAKSPQVLKLKYNSGNWDEVFSKYGTLHVLKGYKNVYSNADYWKKFYIIDDLEEVLVKGLIIDVDNQHFDVNIGGLRAKATPANEDADDWGVTWSTTTPSVMIVVPTTGDFRGLTDGVGELVATANDGSGVVAKAKVYFGAAQPPTIQVASIDITAGKYEMAVGERQTLEATVLPTNASQKTITWSSTAPNIVSIDSYGEITALKSGTAIIIATATDGSGVSGICTITVKPAVGIDNINADDNSNDCNIYTINGVKVKDNNLPAGIYIKNGKKIIVK